MPKNDSTKTYSSKQEKLIAKVLEGKVVTGSGARPVDPGDVKSYDWLAECKTHTEPGHTIFFDLNVWKKICNEADGIHRKPVLIVDDGSQKEKYTWCLCRPFNINMINLLCLDFPVTVRKNISAKHEKLNEVLTNTTKSYVGKFYIGGCYEFEWGGEEICILPLSIFKEVCDN